MTHPMQRHRNDRQQDPEESLDEKRGSWYLLTGLILGLIIGLAYTWWISPVEYHETAPSTLKDSYKDHYRSIIAQVYAATGNLTRAQSRLDLLQNQNPIAALGAQAQQVLASGGSENEARALALLAAALEIQNRTGTPESATATLDMPTATPTSTATPAPTQTIPPSTATPQPTATATEVQTFVLESQEQLCDPKLTDPILKIFVYDANGLPVSGVKIQVTWLGGEEVFYTGLKPEISPGYADFMMTVEENVALSVAECAPLLDLTPQRCTTDEDTYWGGWTLTFQAP